MATKAFLEQAYLAYFGRPIDPNGVAAYVNSTPAQVEAAFWASPESQALYGASFGLQQINVVYNILFGRDAEPAGLTYWANQILIGALTPVSAAIGILNGAQGSDVTAVNNKLSASAMFTAGLDTTAEILGYAGNAAAAVARNFLATITQTPATQAQVDTAINASVAAGTASANAGELFNLTVAPDVVVGTSNNDIVNGYLNTTTPASSTLTAADVINGGAGTDSLKLTVEGANAGSMPNASISNIEQFFIRDVAAIGSNYNFGTIDGETQVWADTATNAAGILQFSNLGTGTTVGVKGNNVLTNLASVFFNMATTTDAVSIAIDGGVKNALNIGAASGTATAATISSTGLANTLGAITLTSGTNTVKALTINATSDLTATLSANDFDPTAAMVVTGKGKVNVGAGFDGATIDASANTGGITVSTTTGVTKSVTGSSAADAVTLVGSLAAAGKIDLGAGNDILLAGAGAAIAGTNVIDGGAGSDSISAILINAANGAAVKNFELLDLSAGTTTPLDLDLITGSTITGLTLSGGGGGANVGNVAAGVGLIVSGNNPGTSTIGVKGATTGTADSFTTTFAGTALPGATATAPTSIVAGTVVTNGVESLSVVSGGTGFVTNSMAVTDNALQMMTITGDKALTLTFAGTNGTAVSGLTDTVNGVKMIDGSAATGALNITTINVTNVANAGLTVKTGAAKDVINLAQKATVDAGGADDTINSSANGGTFTGGAGNDSFNVAAAVATGNTAVTSVFTTITDLAAGDLIKLLVNNVVATTLGAKTALNSTVTNLDQALNMASLTDVVDEVSWFQYGADTYLVANNGTTGFGAGDLVVKITGLVDLSASTLNSATDYLTIG